LKKSLSDTFERKLHTA